MNFTVDLSHLPMSVREAVVKRVVHEDQAQFDLANIEQLRLKKFYDALPLPARPGVGPLAGVMHVGLKNFLAAKYGHVTVYQDPGFLPWLQRKNPEFRGKDAKTKISTGYGELSNHQGAKTQR